MFRFTIRDVLWLTVAVALLLVVAIGYVNRVRMESDISQFKTNYVATRDRMEQAQYAAYQQEILKLSGKRVTGIRYKVDPSNVRQLICEFDFTADEQSQSTNKTK
jgi:hypothetical protein